MQEFQVRENNVKQVITISVKPVKNFKENGITGGLNILL
jgi:hypothetical protein